MVKIIKVDSTSEVKYPKNRVFTKSELETLLQGDIEVIELSTEKILVVNERAWVDNYPFNASASALSKMVINGNVLVGNKEDFDVCLVS